MDTVRCRGCTCTRSCTVALRPPPNKYGCTKVRKYESTKYNYFRTSVLPCVCKLSILPCLALWKYGNRYFRTKVLLPYFVCTKVLSYKVPSYVRVHVHVLYLHTPRRKNIDIFNMCIPVDSWTKFWPRSPNNSPRRTASQPSVSGIRLTHTRC